MENMDRGTIVVLAIAGYLAVTSLVTLMLRWRNQRWEQFRDEMERKKDRKRKRKPKKPTQQQPAAKPG